jgi:hypothetical protein
MRFVMMIIGCLLCAQVNAHQWTPTYPKITSSFVPGIYQAKMYLFNSRKDVSYYTFEVFDGEFRAVPFATAQRTIQLDFLKRQEVVIYFREADYLRSVYICSRSMILQQDKTSTVVSSRICSKIR